MSGLERAAFGSFASHSDPDPVSLPELPCASSAVPEVLGAFEAPTGPRRERFVGYGAGRPRHCSGKGWITDDKGRQTPTRCKREVRMCKSTTTPLEGEDPDNAFDWFEAGLCESCGSKERETRQRLRDAVAKPKDENPRGKW